MQRSTNSTLRRPPPSLTRHLTSKPIFAIFPPFSLWLHSYQKRREWTDFFVDPWMRPYSANTSASHNPASASLEQQLWAQETVPWRVWGHTGGRAPPLLNPLTPPWSLSFFIPNRFPGDAAAASLGTTRWEPLIPAPDWEVISSLQPHCPISSYDEDRPPVWLIYEIFFSVKSPVRGKHPQCNLLMFDFPCCLSRTLVCSVRPTNKPRTCSTWLQKKSCKVTAPSWLFHRTGESCR